MVFSVNALSEKLKLEINRDGKKYYIEFQNGEAKAKLKVIGKSTYWNSDDFFTIKEIFPQSNLVQIFL